MASVSKVLGNKLTEAATHMREIGIVIERPENRCGHTKDVILIKVPDDGEPGTSPLESPNVPYTPPPEHTLEQSPCHPIIAVRQGYFYCRFHPEIKNVHLESIEHHIKYREPAVHQSELLRFAKLTHD